MMELLSNFAFDINLRRHIMAEFPAIIAASIAFSSILYWCGPKP